VGPYSLRRGLRPSDRPPGRTSPRWPSSSMHIGPPDAITPAMRKQYVALVGAKFRTREYRVGGAARRGGGGPLSQVTWQAAVRIVRRRALGGRPSSMASPTMPQTPIESPSGDTHCNANQVEAGPVIRSLEYGSSTSDWWKALFTRFTRPQGRPDGHRLISGTSDESGGRNTLVFAVQLRDAHDCEHGMTGDLGLINAFRSESRTRRPSPRAIAGQE